MCSLLVSADWYSTEVVMFSLNDFDGASRSWKLLVMYVSAPKCQKSATVVLPITKIETKRKINNKLK